MSSRRRDKGNGGQIGVLERGNLEDISRPSSNRLLRSDRAMTSATSSIGVGSASSVSRLRPQVAAALELLTPEEVMEQEYELDLQEFSGSSDETSDDLAEITGRTSELFRIAEPLKTEANNQQFLDESDDEDKQIVLFGSLCGDDETMVDSDEEKAIMKDIRAEITAQIRGEMKSELEVFKKKREALTSACGSEKETKDDLDENISPELRQAIIKMRKLDKILDKKVKKEKEVKRDRIILQRKLHEELVNLKPEDGGRELKEVQMNTAKFLSLTLPPSHNSGIKVDDIPAAAAETPHPPITPVFATQYEDDSQSTSRSTKTSRTDTSSQQAKGGKGKSMGQGTHRTETSNGTTKHDDAQSTMSGGTNSTNLTGSTRTRRTKRNFIKRNKELASDAANMIAMTDEEKNRVDNLLFNLDALPEEDLEGDVATNAFQIVPSLGEGYQPEREEMKRLQDIDHRLKALLPPEDFAMIAAPPTPRSLHSALSGQGTLFTRTALDTETDIELGENILKENREERDIQKRLRDIEGELNTLTSAVEHEMESPKLSGDQLQNLLDKCASAMRRAQDETDNLAMSQKDALALSRASMLENAPPLEDNVLQTLLAEARTELRLTPSEQDTTPTPSNREGYTDGESDLGDRIQELLANSRLRSRNSSRNQINESQTEFPLQFLDSNNEVSIPETGFRESTTPGSRTETSKPSSPNQYSTDDATAPTTNNREFREHPDMNAFRRNPHREYNGVPNGSQPTNDADDLHLVSYDEEMMQAAFERNGMISKSGERQRFLPEIDPHGSLVGTPKHSKYSNNMDDDTLSVGSNSARSSYSKMNSNLSIQGRQPSFDGDFRNAPRPPDGARPQGGSAGKHRSIVSRTNGDINT